MMSKTNLSTEKIYQPTRHSHMRLHIWKNPVQYMECINTLYVFLITAF